MAHDRHHVLALALVLAVPLAACDDDDPVQPQPDPAMVRIVNAAHATTDISVRRTGSDVTLATLDFGETTTTCIAVPPGDRTFTFRSGGTELASVSGDLQTGENYFLVLASPGAGTQRRAVLATDEHAAVAGNNVLRLVNATSAAGDVYVTTPAGAPGGAFLVSGNLSPLAMSNDLLTTLPQRAVEHTRVRLFDVDETTDARADLTLTGLPASRIATVVFTDVGADPEDRAFLVFPCS